MTKLNWHKIEPFHAHKPTERWGHSSCVIASDLIVFGGYADNYYMNDLWTFSTLTLEWKYHDTSGNIPEPRSNATLNFDAKTNRLILFGGGAQGKKRINSIYALNWQTKKWTELEPLNHEHKPWQRTYHVAEIIDNYLAVFGGQNFADLNDLWLFDLQLKTWHEVKIPLNATRPSPRRFHSAVLRNNELIIIGGCHSKYRSLKDVYSMDFSQFLISKDINMLSWRQIIVENSDFIPRWGHSSSYNILNDKIYIFGGRFSNDLQDIIILDTDQRTSKKVHVNSQETPCPRRRHSANFIGCSLVIFGGFNGNYFNDLYSICIPAESPIPKLTKDSVIGLGEFLRKQHKDTVSFMERYMKNFQNILVELRQKYDQKGIQQILSSIVRGYELFPQKHTCEIDSLTQRCALSQKVHTSKQQKIQQIRCEYTMCHVLQQKTTPVQRHKYLNSFKKTYKQTHPDPAQCSNSYKLFPPYEISAQIVLINEMDFYHYMQDHNKVLVKHVNTRFYRYLDDAETEGFRIDIKGIGRFVVDPVITFTNPYFCHAFKQSRTISFDNINLNNLKVFQVGLMFLQTNILVVPTNFTFDHWKRLAEFANYFCVQNLLQIVQKFFIAKIDLGNIPELCMVACDFKMRHLMHKCTQMIIEREQQRFFLQKNPVMKINPDLFQQFERRFFEKLQNFVYPEEFQKKLTKEFDIGKLDIFLRNIQKIREMSGNVKNKGCEENEEKQNEEILVDFR